MVLAQFVPWYDRPARRFPVHIWLEKRYGFRLPPLRFSEGGQPERREFPAQRWARARAAGVV